MRKRKTFTEMPAISVCLPMYNSSRFLRECIDSILVQTFSDFELLIVDDGSTDNSRDIVLSYSDSRIRLICNKHDYIESLNTLLREARGKYIARMDSDDIMLPNRLEVQYAYMENNPHIDVLAGGMSYIGDLNGEYIPFPTYVGIAIEDMLKSCCIAHPTVFLKSSSVAKYNIHYNPSFVYAEDYKLWVDLLKQGVTLVNIPNILIQYRVSKGQISHRKQNIQYKTSQLIQQDTKLWLKQAQKEVAREEIEIPYTGNLLSLVIPFLNEGEEVANTVRSARHFVGNKVDIIVINDHSNDGFDYIKDLRGLNVYYVSNRVGIGAAASKAKGARLVKTPYFILLDAHMRFYDDTWYSTYINELKRNMIVRKITHNKSQYYKKGSTFAPSNESIY